MRISTLSRSMLLCSLCIAMTTVRAQYVSIPDTNFAQALAGTLYYSCVTGNSTVGYRLDTVTARTIGTNTLSVPGRNISDVTGMEYLTYANTIDLSNNKLRRLPLSHLPPAIFYFGAGELDCSHNLIDTIALGVDGPSIPFIVDASYNQITTFLPPTPTFTYTRSMISSLNSSGYIRLSYNQLDSANAANVVAAGSPYWLYMDHNNIGGTFSVIGKRGDLQNNHLTKVIYYPNWTFGFSQDLNIDSNDVTTLIVEAAMNGISLSASHNLIDSLSDPGYYYGSEGFDNIDLSYNHLHNIPNGFMPPYGDVTLNCSHNPNLTCLPLLPILNSVTLNFDSTAVGCIPNRYYNTTYISTPDIYSLPLCSYSTGTACNNSFNLAGQGYQDLNGNCQRDSGENLLYDFGVTLYHNGSFYARTTSYDGYYVFDIGDTGTFTLVVDTAALGLNYQVSCPAGNSYQFFLAATDSVVNHNIGFSCTGMQDVAAISINGSGGTHILRQSLHFHDGIILQVGPPYVTGGSCAGTVPGLVKLVMDTNVVTFLSSTPTAYTSGDTVIWSLANIAAAPQLGLTVQPNLNLPIGTQTCMTLIVEPAAPDADAADNVLVQCFTLAASYDPNHKESSPAGNIQATQQSLTYTIAFENTGNDTAYYVHINDYIDTSVLQLTTIELVASSTPCVMDLEPATNMVSFEFPNINLVDSTHNDSMCTGWVQYRISLKPNLPLGTVISNTAAIYFDQNTAVLTDTTINTIVAAPVCTDTTIYMSRAICQGDSFAFGGVPLTASGTYVDTLTNVGGCDSIVTLTLTVNPLPVVSFTLDSMSQEVPFNLMSPHYGIWCFIVPPASYDFPLAGGVPSGGVYTGKQVSNDSLDLSGNYFEQIDSITYTYTDSNGCTNMVIDTLVHGDCDGINTISGGNPISLYPNPNHGSFTLSSSYAIGSEYTITDMLGDVIAQDVIRADEQAIELKDAAEGVYTLVVRGAQPVRFVVVR